MVDNEIESGTERNFFRHEKMHESTIIFWFGWKWKWAHIRPKMSWQNELTNWDIIEKKLGDSLSSSLSLTFLRRRKIFRSFLNFISVAWKWWTTKTGKNAGILRSIFERSFITLFHFYSNKRTAFRQTCNYEWIRIKLFRFVFFHSCFLFVSPIDRNQIKSIDCCWAEHTKKEK